MEKMKIAFGFTLVELLVTIAIIGTISIVSVRMLYDIVSLRAKQQTIEDSSDSFRVLTRYISKSVTEAKKINVQNPSSIQIIGDGKCETIRYSSSNHTIEKAENFGNPCVPPDTNFKSLTNSDLYITKLNFTPIGMDVKLILLEIEGKYIDSLGNHPISYTTTISKRI